MTILKDGLFVGGTTLTFETEYDEFGMPKISPDHHYVSDSILLEKYILEIFFVLVLDV